MKKCTLLLFISMALVSAASAQSDTIRVMSYNVLYYGDIPPCQGPHSASHGYLKTIVQYANPDVLGLVKMAAMPMYTGDASGSAPLGFADSVLQYSLNLAFPGRYKYCTLTNASGADDMAVLFYDQTKLGFGGIASAYTNINDFNTYKLYYKAADLALTHDTVFLYIALNHTQSGSSSSDEATRGTQVSGEMATLATHFTQLPNMINMGDYNTHNSSEACYQALVSPADTGFKFYDPPFHPDGLLSYPADWDNNPGTYAPFLTTSTRLSGSIPNSCGTSGGGKSWYDHIFLSSALVYNSHHAQYVSGSYRTLGNDGLREGISINSAPTNTAAPSAVITALFQMSNKYPIMVNIAITPPTGVLGADRPLEQSAITVGNPVGSELILHCNTELVGSYITISCIDLLGQLQFTRFVQVSGSMLTMPSDLTPGLYFIRVNTGNALLEQMLITKD